MSRAVCGTMLGAGQRPAREEDGHEHEDHEQRGGERRRPTTGAGRRVEPGPAFDCVIMMAKRMRTLMAPM